MIVNRKIFLSLVFFVMLCMPYKSWSSQDYTASLELTKTDIKKEIEVQSSARIGNNVLVVWGTRQIKSGYVSENILIEEMIEWKPPYKKILNQKCLHSPEAHPYKGVFVIPLQDKFIVFWNDKRDNTISIAYQALDTNGLNIGIEGRIGGFEIGVNGIKIVQTEDGYVLAFNSNLPKGGSEIKAIKLSHNAEVLKVINIKSTDNIKNLTINGIGSKEFICLITEAETITINSQLEFDFVHQILKNSIANNYPIYTHSNGVINTIDRENFYEFGSVTENPRNIIKGNFNTFSDACIWQDSSDKIVVFVLNKISPPDILTKYVIDTTIKKYILISTDYVATYDHKSSGNTNAEYTIYHDCTNKVGLHLTAVHVLRVNGSYKISYDTANYFARGYSLKNLPYCNKNYFTYKPVFMPCVRVPDSNKSIVNVGLVRLESEFTESNLTQNLEQKNLGLFEKDGKIFSVYHNVILKKETTQKTEFDSSEIIAAISPSGEKSTYQAVSNFLLDNEILSGAIPLEYPDFMNFSFNKLRNNTYQANVIIPSETNWEFKLNNSDFSNNETYEKALHKFCPDEKKWSSLILTNKEGAINAYQINFSYWNFITNRYLPSVEIFGKVSEYKKNQLLDFIPIGWQDYYLIVDSVIKKIIEGKIVNEFFLSEKYIPNAKFKTLLGGRIIRYYTNSEKSQLMVELYDSNFIFKNKFSLEADIHNGFMIIENPADTALVLVYSGKTNGVKAVYRSKNLEVLEINYGSTEAIQISQSRATTNNPIGIFVSNKLYVSWEENRTGNSDIYFNSWLVPEELRRAGSAGIENDNMQKYKFQLQ